MNDECRMMKVSACVERLILSLLGRDESAVELVGLFGSLLAKTRVRG